MTFKCEDCGTETEEPSLVEAHALSAVVWVHMTDDGQITLELDLVTVAESLYDDGGVSQELYDKFEAARNGRGPVEIDLGWKWRR